MEVLAAEHQRVGANSGAVGQHQVLGRFLETQRSRGIEEIGDLDLEVARCADQRAVRAVEIKRYVLGNAGVAIARHRHVTGDHGQRAAHAAVVDHGLGVGAQVDRHRQVAGAHLDQRQANFGGRLGCRLQADPAARHHGCGAIHRRSRALEIHRHRQVDAGQLETGGRGVGRLIAEQAVVVAVDAVRAVQPDESV